MDPPTHFTHDLTAMLFNSRSFLAQTPAVNLCLSLVSTRAFVFFWHNYAFLGFRGSRCSIAGRSRTSLKPVVTRQNGRTLYSEEIAFTDC